MRILVVEDDSLQASALVEVLEAEHYAVDLAADGGLADELMSINSYDLVLLDWSLPNGVTGLDLLRQWRECGSTVPVLMLTARREVGDRVDGLDTGADDYLTKPFAFDELMARVRSLMRRRDKVMMPISAGDVILDRASRVVTVAGEVVDLTPKELGVLEYLLAHVDQPVSRTNLAEHVWDDNFDAMSNVIDVIIYRLRKKVDGQHEHKLLETIKGMGYVLRSSRR